MSVIRPYVPQENSINDAALCYLSCERAVLDEMRAQVATWARVHLGPDWHTIVRDDPNLWGIDAWDQPEDAFYILKCLAQIPISKISNIFGHPKDIGPKAKPVFMARNRWSHFSNQLVMSTIQKEIAQLRDFAGIAGLEVAHDVADSLRELERLASTSEASPSTPRPRRPLTEETHVIPARPRVGEPWMDELPSEVWEISEKLRDVKAKSDGQSMKSRFEDKEEGRFAVARLFHLNLSPRVLYVDPADGAMVGFREGHPYLVGYAGPTPDSAQADYQGFFEPEALEFTGGDLLVRTTGQTALASWEGRRKLIQALSDQGVSEEDEVLITDFGHLVAISEKGAKKVGDVGAAALEGFWESS